MPAAQSSHVLAGTAAPGGRGQEAAHPVDGSLGGWSLDASSLGDRLLDAMAGGQRGDEVRRLLSLLRTHLVERFGSEELEMRRRCFPGYEGHRLAHQVFLEELGHIEASCLGYGLSEPLADRIAIFVTTWLGDHFQVADRHSAAFLARQASPVPA
jgi:hemerythrin-like metal-binding protein